MAVVNGGTVRLQKVTVARDLGTQIEVRDGVEPGDEVILKPALTLVNGSKVQPQVATAQR